MALWLGSPTLAVSAAFGAFSAGVATFQRSWRPRPWLALAAAAGLAVSTFLGYLAATHTLTFVLMLAVWTLMTGMSWAGRPGLRAGLHPDGGRHADHGHPADLDPGRPGHALLVGLGGVVQATLIVLFPVRPWGVQRDALADALAAVADYALQAALRADGALRPQAADGGPQRRRPDSASGPAAP
ncbi:hypothetical protein SANTM175S_01029 [Streptomyces antimycoticus]